MPADDLNRRVQTRLAELEAITTNPDHQWTTDARWRGDAPAWVMWATRSNGYAKTLVASWRERWERHRPYGPEEHQDEFDDTVWCRKCGGDPDNDEAAWPCPDALSVLKEIGVQL